MHLAPSVVPPEVGLLPTSAVHLTWKETMYIEGLLYTENATGKASYYPLKFLAIVYKPKGALPILDAADQVTRGPTGVCACRVCAREGIGR